MSDINLHDDAPHQDWQGGPHGTLKDDVIALRSKLDEIVHRHISKALNEAEPVSFTDRQLEHIFEHARSALHKRGELNWADASRLAECIRTRIKGGA